jgi:hypothetical protein
MKSPLSESLGGTCRVAFADRNRSSSAGCSSLLDYHHIRASTRDFARETPLFGRDRA